MIFLERTITVVIESSGNNPQARKTIKGELTGRVMRPDICQGTRDETFAIVILLELLKMHYIFRLDLIRM